MLAWRASAAVLLLCVFSAADAAAHCDLAYVAGPARAYRQEAVWQSRTSYEKARTETGGQSATMPPPAAVLSAMPADVRLPTYTDDDQIRQRSLTYWLTYVQALDAAQNYPAVLSTISNLRRTILRAASKVQNEFDDGDLEEDPAFGVGTLVRIFNAYERAAKLVVISSSGFSPAYRHALVDFIQSEATTFNFGDRSSWSLERGSFRPKLPARALEPAAQFARARASEKQWQRIAEMGRYAEILGVSTDVEGQISMYIHADPAVGSIHVDTATGVSNLNAGMTCRNNFEGDLSKIQANYRKSQRVVVGAVLKSGSRYVLTTGNFRHVYLAESDYDKLAAGVPVSAESGEEAAAFDRVIREFIEEKKSLVLWAHPMMQKAGDSRSATMGLAYALTRAYPELNIVIDPPTERTAALARVVAQQMVPATKVYVALDDAVKVQQEARERAPVFKSLVGKRNVFFLDANTTRLAPSKAHRAVIVITGHTDEALEAHIDRLAAKGYLKNNLVVLQACGDTALSPKLVAKINGEYGAAGTFHYPDPLVEEDAVDFAESVLRELNSRRAFGRIVRERTVKRSGTWKGMVRGVWTISQIENAAGRHG